MVRLGLLIWGLLALPPFLSAQFAPAPNSPFVVPEQLTSLAAGDFNDDAKPDIAVAGRAGFGGAVSLLLSDGSGGFTVAQGSPYSTGQNPGSVYPASLATGDFFSDGNSGLAVGTLGTTVPIMRGGVQEVTSPVQQLSGAVSVTAGDFNGDGNLDLAIASGAPYNLVEVYYGNGAGGFPVQTSTAFRTGANPWFVTTADLNGDGKLDLVIANLDGGNVTVLLGDGSGRFSAAGGSPFAAGKGPVCIAVGDFNGDGRPDLAVANAGGANVALLLGDGTGGFSPAPASPFPVGPGPHSLVAADFNGDGALDIAVANSLDSTTSVLLGNGAGGFTAAPGSPFATGKNPVSVVAADFNGDGQPDLAIGNQASNNITVLLNTFPARSGPTITNVQNAATLLTTIGQNSYMAIFGNGLSGTNAGRSWTSSDFVNNPNGTLSMPTSLDGTSVTVGNVPAYVSYVSSNQINIVSPAVTGPNIPVVVRMNGQASAPFTVNMESLRPSFFTWQPATADFGKYLVAQHADYTNVGKTGLFPGAPPNFTTPAKPGETILLYGTGFGPTNPPVAQGIETDKIYPLVPMPTATLGNLAATVAFAGLIPALSQVYQVNVTIPPNAPDGDQALIVTVNGTHSYLGLITVQR